MLFKHNIANPTGQLRACTSCQLCAAVCPVDAIRIEADPNGFYRPVVDQDKCVDCKRCISVCYRYDTTLCKSSHELLNSSTHYSAWSSLPSLLETSTSGGVSTILSNRLIEEGYQISGVYFNPKYQRLERANSGDRSFIPKFQGTKYAHALSERSLRAIVRSKHKEKFVVFGLPCEIYGLRQYAKKHRQEDGIVLIDFYCHGCPSNLIFDKYLKEKARLFGVQRFESINSRTKDRTEWGQFRTQFLTYDVEEERYLGRVNDEFYDLFFSNQLLNEPCGDCPLRGCLEFSDIRLGDFWGRKYIDNNKGVSLVSVNTEKGREIFDLVGSQMVSMPVSPEEFSPYQSLFNTYRIDPSLRNELLAGLRNPSLTLKELVEFYTHRLPPAKKLKHFARKAANHLPSCLVRNIKKLYYNLKN